MEFWQRWEIFIKLPSITFNAKIAVLFFTQHLHNNYKTLIYKPTVSGLKTFFLKSLCQILLMLLLLHLKGGCSLLLILPPVQPSPDVLPSLHFATGETATGDHPEPLCRIQQRREWPSGPREDEFPWRAGRWLRAETVRGECVRRKLVLSFATPGAETEGEWRRESEGGV